MANILTNIIDSFTGGFENKLGLNQNRGINKNSIIYANSILQYTRNRIIKYGDRGQIVKDLEYVLNLLGYKTYSTSSPDGVYGNRVKSAVASIQMRNGIINNGEVGYVTARILYNTIYHDIKEESIVPNMINKYISEKVYPKAENKFNTYLKENGVNVVPVGNGEYQLPLKKKSSIIMYVIGGGILLGGIYLFKKGKI